MMIEAALGAQVTRKIVRWGRQLYVVEWEYGNSVVITECGKVLSGVVLVQEQT